MVEEGFVVDFSDVVCIGSSVLSVLFGGLVVVCVFIVDSSSVVGFIVVVPGVVGSGVSVDIVAVDDGEEDVFGSLELVDLVVDRTGSSVSSAGSIGIVVLCAEVVSDIWVEDAVIVSVGSCVEGIITDVWDGVIVEEDALLVEVSEEWVVVSDTDV